MNAGGKIKERILVYFVLAGRESVMGSLRLDEEDSAAAEVEEELDNISDGGARKLASLARPASKCGLH
eukprot:229768-Rhodomonas_salina.2